MAQNLVPLFLDKDSGDLIATKSQNNGNGNGNNGRFEHLQTAPALVWNVTHALDTKRLLVQIYDLNDIQIYPDEVKLLTDDIVRVTFNTAQAGSAKIVFF